MIVIIGAGISGLAMANALAQKNIAVTMIDNKPEPTPFNAKHYDLRVSAITRMSQKLFQQLGVWNEIEQTRIGAYEKMLVWDGNGAGKIFFDAASIQETNLGHIIENSLIQTALLHQLKQHPLVTLLFEKNLINIHEQETTVEIECDDHSKISADYLIGADGANSWVRKQCQIKTDIIDYQQLALVATIKTEKPHQKTAMQRFYQHGALAFLPLDDPHTCSIVWALNKEKMENILIQPKENIQDQLAASFDQHLGKIMEMSDWKTFPLYYHHAKNYVTHRIALIGDAAHYIHPLAGQGLNLGLLDVITLTEVISKNQNLKRYQQTRRPHNLVMMQSINAIKKLFAEKNPAIRFIRNLGLNLVDRFTPMKNHFIRQAMGISEYHKTAFKID